MTAHEYLAGGYEPEYELVDGQLEARNIGERDHSLLQGEVCYQFRSREHGTALRVYPSLSVRLSENTIRIPDVALTLGRPVEPIPSAAPLLCIEILSPDDRFSRVQRKAKEYLDWGVPAVWIIDAGERRAWMHTKDGVREAAGSLRLEHPTVEIPLTELFAALD